MATKTTRRKTTEKNIEKESIEKENSIKKDTVVTPEKEKNPAVIWYYRLQDGSNIVCNDMTEVMMYEEEYDNVIEKKFTFSNKADYDKFLVEENQRKEKLDKEIKGKQSNKKPKLDTEAQEKAKALARKVINVRERNKPRNKLELYYRAIPMCTKAIVIVHYMNMRSQHLFYAKPKNLHDNTKTFVTELDYDVLNIPKDDVVHNMILNMTHYRMRNPDSGPDSVVKNYSKVNKGKYYEEEVTVTELDIPSTIASLKEEDTYIKGKLQLFGKTLLTVQGSDAFKEVLVDQLIENITKWMYGDDETQIRFTFQQWCDCAEIQMERINNINTYITLEDAKKIKMMMANHRCTPRYRIEMSETVLLNQTMPTIVESDPTNTL